MREILPTLGITATFVDSADAAAVEAAIQDNTKMRPRPTPRCMSPILPRWPR